MLLATDAVLSAYPIADTVRLTPAPSTSLTPSQRLTPTPNLTPKLNPEPLYAALSQKYNYIHKMERMKMFLYPLLSNTVKISSEILGL